jgi:hypothetical protein
MNKKKVQLSVIPCRKETLDNNNTINNLDCKNYLHDGLLKVMSCVCSFSFTWKKYI